MKPITRKELYLNKIVGNDDYDIPEKPITTEEFFFAEILGEAVQAPEPLTRYQIYLAKIAGKDVEIPYPETRHEYFLARAAGMDIETPTPITREEIFWSNYSAIVNFDVEGVPPLTYKAIEGTLKNYRIYGRTSRNLFDMKKFAELCYPRYASVTFADNILSFTPIVADAYVNDICSEGDTAPDEYRPSCINVLPSTTYTISMSSAPKCYISWISSSFKGVSAYTQIPANQSSYTFTTPKNCTKLLFRLGKKVTNIEDTFTISNIMLNLGSTPLPYEPYGESVGDRTANLFDGEFLQGYWALADGAFMVSDKWICTQKIQCKANTDYTFTFGIKSRWYGIAWYDIDGNYIEFTDSNIHSQPTIFTATSPANAAFMGIDIAGFQDSTGQVYYDIHPSDVTDFMLVESSTALPYEPYGYKVPVTVTNGADTQTIPIYLPEQIKMVGDEAEYISYSDQKLHRIGADDIDVTLPELPTLAGTNALTVGTEVQPSKVYIKGEKEREYS